MPHWQADPARFAALCQCVVECVFGQRLGPDPTQRGLAPQIRWRPWCLRAASCSKPITYLHCFLYVHTISKQVRNRFAAQSPPGGYRDMNLKIRVGFKSDPNTGHPLFCPVYVESFAADAKILLLYSHERIQERMGPERRQNHGESFCIAHHWLAHFRLAGCGNSSSSQGETFHACFVQSKWVV